MSDTPVLRRVLPDYVTEDIRGISVQSWRNNQLKYVEEQKQKNKESFCCIDIPFPLLLCWEKIETNTTFVKLLNNNIPGCGFAVKENAVRIEERLRVKCSSISSRFKAASGRKKRDVLSGSYRMNIFVEEVESVEVLNERLEKEEKTKKNLEHENKILYEELIEEVQQKKLREDELLSETESLKQYIEKLERNRETDKNGKDLSALSPTTRWRYLKDLTTRAQKALWFMNAYGLKLSSLEVEENNKTKHKLNLNDIPTTTNPVHANNTNQGGKYLTLPEDEKKKVEEVLFLMDRFGVSDEFYHHLTMIFDGLPRSYLVKQCKSNLNTMRHLTPTPGKSPGVQTSFKELLREQILDLVSIQTFIPSSYIHTYMHAHTQINIQKIFSEFTFFQSHSNIKLTLSISTISEKYK